MERFKVVGPLPVGDVEPGGTVELDPEQVNIPALIEAGHVERIGGSKAPKSQDRP